MKDGLFLVNEVRKKVSTTVNRKYETVARLLRISRSRFSTLCLRESCGKRHSCAVCGTRRTVPWPTHCKTG